MEYSQTPTRGTSVHDNEANNSSAITSPSPQFASTDDAKSAEVLFIQGLLSILRELTEQKREPWLKRFLSHGMTLLIAGVLLSGGVGSFLTYYYNKKAQELAAERSFSDELNKTQIQKLGEVWERVDQDQVKIEILMNQIAEGNPDDKATQNAVLQQIEKLIATDKETVGQNRFWITQDTANKLNRYLDATFFLLTRQILEPEAETEPLVKERDAARSDVDTERAKFLNSQGASRCYLF